MVRVLLIRVEQPVRGRPRLARVAVALQRPQLARAAAAAVKRPQLG